MFGCTTSMNSLLQQTLKLSPPALIPNGPQKTVRKAPSFSGLLMLPNRASANSLSAPIKSSGGFRDSLDDKSKSNLVQVKGRFSVTSENLDPVKGSALRKSASVGEWLLESKMPTSQPVKELSNYPVPAMLLMPHLQDLFQQTSIQLDLITNILSTLQPSEMADGSQNEKLLSLPQGSENSVEQAVSETEWLLLFKISELQARMKDLTEELDAENLKYAQLQEQLKSVTVHEF